MSIPSSTGTPMSSAAAADPIAGSKKKKQIPSVLSTGTASKSGTLDAEKFSLVDPNTPLRKLAPFPKKVIEQIVEGFAKAFRFILRKPTPLQLKGLELSFAMELYRSSDDLLVELSKGGLKTPDTLPYSTLLQLWSKFLKNAEKNQDISADDSSRELLHDIQKHLKGCAAIQRSIEKIDKLDEKKQLAAYKKLYQKLHKSLKHLKEGEKLYIPGAFRDENGTHYLIYEFEKEGDHYKFHATGVGQTSSSFELTDSIDENDLSDALTGALASSVDWKGVRGEEKIFELMEEIQNLIGTSSTPAEIVKTLSKSPHKVFKLFNRLVGFKFVAKLIFSKKFRQDYFSLEGLMKYIKERNPTFADPAELAAHIDVENAREIPGSPEKTLEVFFKSKDKDLGVALKLNLKAALLADIYHKAKSRLDHYPDLRRELQHEMMNLYNLIDRHHGHLELEAPKNLLIDLIEDIKEIDAREHQIPSAPGKQRGVKTSFKSLVHLPQTVTPLKKFHTVPPETQASVSRAAVPKLAGNTNDETLENIGQAREICQNLIESNDYASSDGLLMEIIDQLQEIDLSALDEEQVKNHMQFFTLALAHTHFALRREAVSPTLYNQLAILASKYDPDFFAGGGTEQGKAFFFHPYLDLGAYATEDFIDRCSPIFGAMTSLDFSELTDFKRRSILRFDFEWFNDHFEGSEEEKGRKFMAFCMASLIAGEMDPKKNGPIIKDDEVAARIIEARVTDDGLPPDPIALPKIDETGLREEEFPYAAGPTAHNILEEKYCFKGLPMDVSAELQLMQTDPDSNNRIKYALGAFSKISGIFGDAQIGRDWQRAFSIILFQNASLDRLITEEPEYALVYLEVLRGMIEDAQASNNIEAALFLIRIHRESLPIIEGLEKKIQEGEIEVEDEARAKIESKLEEYYDHLADDFEQIRTWREKAESEASDIGTHDKVTNILRNRGLIHQQFLYHFSLNSSLPDEHPMKYDLEDEDSLKEIFVSSFILQQTSTTAASPLDIEREVNRIIQKTAPKIQTLLESMDNAALQEWLLPLLPPEGQDLEIDGTYPLYKAGPYVLDVEKKLLYIDGKAKRLIPSVVASNPLCERIFGETGLYSLQASYKNVSYFENDVEKHAEKYTFKFNGERYCIISKDNGDEILLYKECQPPGEKRHSWFQCQMVDFLDQDWDSTAYGIDQGHNLKPPRQFIPKEITGRNLWVHERGRFLFAEGVDSAESFFVRLSKRLPKEWNKAVHSSDRTFRTAAQIHPAKDTAHGSSHVLNPWRLPSFKIFQALDTYGNIVATGKKGKVERIKYSRLNLTYVWDKVSATWQATQFPGFSLSKKKIGSFLSLAHPEKKVPLFVSTFHDYQILEHPTKLPKLLLNCCAYERGVEKDIYKVLPAHSEDSSHLFAFDIDPQLGLKCTSAAGYFYLSYVLLTQKRYDEAIAYLKKANSLEIHQTDQFENILSWLRDWKDDSSEALAFRLHLECQMFQWQRTNDPKALTSEEGQRNIRKLAKKWERYQESIESIPSNMLLSKRQEELLESISDYNLLEEYNRVVEFVANHNEFDALYAQLKGKGSHEADTEDFEDLEELKQALKDEKIPFDELKVFAEQGLLEGKAKDGKLLTQLLAIEQNHGFCLLRALRENIAAMDERIEGNAPADNAPERKLEEPVLSPIFPQEFLDSILEERPAKVGNYKKKVTSFKDAFMQDKDNKYLRERGRQLAGDIKVAVKDLEQLKGLKGSADIDALLHALRSGNPELHLEGYKHLKKEASNHKTEILKLFTVSSVEPDSDWEKVKLSLEQREETLNHLFNRARYCYAANDFSELVAEGVLKEEDVDALKDHMTLFFETDTRRQQYFRAIEKAIQIQEGGDIEILGPQLVQILTQQRAYDVSNDPDSPLLAVFEWECGYIATPAQINNFKTMLTEANLFKQEALAGGKTVVIRNIIAKYKADGYFLAGAITHIPLMEMHHPLFERAAREAYGEKVFTFTFSRKTPTDTASLTQILFNLKEMIVEKGRVDLSKRDLLSLHHAVLLKWEELQDAAIEHGLKPDPRKSAADERTHRELDVCNEILSLLEKHLKLGSDELDTITNCEEEHIFACGGKMPLNPQKVDCALQIMLWILTEDTLKKERKAFRNNLQSNFTPEEREEFIDKLAALVHQTYAPDLDEDELINYLTLPLEEGETAEFYNKSVLTHAEAQNLQVFKKYFQDIITESTLAKKGGVKFGRSKEDGWIVKPYEFSDQCMENSQQSSEEETIWFTICNYMNCKPFQGKVLGGVMPEQISELVQTKQAEAAKEIKTARKLDKIISFKDTKAAKEWDANFSIPLIEIIPEQYEQIAAEINGDPQLLRNFLLHYVIPKNYSSPTKVAANADDLAEMVCEFYGSSGTSELAPTFPEKMVLKEELVNQEGVNGRVLWALMKIFKPGDIIYSNDIIKTLGEEMKEGDALIDLSPFFAGISGNAIARIVGAELKARGKVSPDGVIRFVDSKNEPGLLELATDKEQPISGNINVKKTTNVMGQKDARGTNFEMADDSVGYLTIGPHTALTEFFQAALRMRKLPERLLSDSEKGQGLRYILAESVKARLGDDPTFEELVAFLTENEIKRLKLLRFKKEKQKIEAIPRCALFRALSKTQDPEARRVIWPLVREFFFQPSQATIDAGGAPNQMMDSLEILKGMAGKKREKIEAVQNFLNGIIDDEDTGLSEDTLNDLEAFLHVLDDIDEALEKKESGETLPKAKYLPPKMSTTATELDMHQTAEQEQELEAEQQQQLQQQSAAIDGKPVSTPRPNLNLKRETPEGLCDKLYQIKTDAKVMNPKGLYQSLKRAAPIMDDYTYYTRGAYPNFMDGQDPWSELDPAKAGQIQIPRVLIMVDKRYDPARVVSLVGTTNDFNEIEAFVKAHRDNAQIDLYITNIRNDKLDGGRYEWSDEYPEEVNETIARRLIQMKFLNGEIDLLNPEATERSPIRHEYTAFKDWLDYMIEEGLSDAENLEEIFLQYLQAYRPSQVPQYHTSAVAEVFQELQVTA